MSRMASTELERELTAAALYDCENDMVSIVACQAEVVCRVEVDVVEGRKGSRQSHTASTSSCSAAAKPIAWLVRNAPLLTEHRAVAGMTI